MRIEESSPSYNVNEEPLVISKQTMDKLLTLDNPSTAIALYSFYYYTAKWQGTNQAKAVEGYCKEGIKIGQRAFRRAKKDLKELGLISDIQKVKNGKVAGHYIKVNFVFYDKEKLNNQALQNERMDNENQTLQNALVQNVTTNALTTNNRNALNTAKDDFPEEPKNKPKKKSNEGCDKPEEVDQEVWDDFIRQRKALFSKTALKMFTSEAKKAGYTLNDAFKESVLRGWQSFKEEWVRGNKPQPNQTKSGSSIKFLGGGK